jgi:hypothetical protein
MQTFLMDREFLEDFLEKTWKNFAKTWKNEVSPKS